MGENWHEGSYDRLGLGSPSGKDLPSPMSSPLAGSATQAAQKSYLEFLQQVPSSKAFCKVSNPLLAHVELTWVSLL